MGVIKKQAINNTITSYTGAVLGFVIVYFQPHFISADEIGLLRLLYSASLMAALIMPLGTGSMIMRFFPQVRDDAARHNGFFGLALLIATVASLAIAILLFFFWVIPGPSRIVE